MYSEPDWARQADTYLWQPRSALHCHTTSFIRHMNTARQYIHDMLVRLEKSSCDIPVGCGGPCICEKSEHWRFPYREGIISVSFEELHLKSKGIRVVQRRIQSTHWRRQKVLISGHCNFTCAIQVLENKVLGTFIAVPCRPYTLVPLPRWSNFV